MSQNLHLFHLQEARLQNSKRKKSQKSKENVSKEFQSDSQQISHKKMSKLTKKDRREILQNKDFNFELGQEFLESRHVAYQSKDLKHSLRNAKQVEKTLMQLQLGDSPETFARPSPDSPLLPSFPKNEVVPFFHASKNKFSDSSNSFGKDSSSVSELLGQPRFEHDLNDELVLAEYSSGSDIKSKRRRQRPYEGGARMHLYRRADSEEVSNIRLENRNRMARRETQNPLMQFFKLILVKLGCSDH